MESSMFVSPAFAGAAAPPAGFEIMSFLPLILIFIVFYFLLIRPQQKRVKEQKAMLTALRRGDRVVTGGGIIGTISKIVSDEEVVVELAEGVRVRVLRATIASVLAKTEPGKGGADKDEDEAELDANATPPAPKSGKAGGRR
jgi:preprotein translocase subunit YajC